MSDNKHTIGALEGFLHDVWEGESNFEDVLNIMGYNELKHLIDTVKQQSEQIEKYKKAFEHIEGTIYSMDGIDPSCYEILDTIQDMRGRDD